MNAPVRRITLVVNVLTYRTTLASSREVVLSILMTAASGSVALHSFSMAVPVFRVRPTP